jgi:altronate dehydratase large subunit
MTFISSPELNNFRGYIQNDGKVGVRNDLLILNITGLTEAIAYRIGSGLNGAKVISFPYGLGLFGKDADISLMVLRGLALNPNSGAVLVLSADRNRLEEIIQTLEIAGKPYKGIALDETGHDSLKMINMGLKAGAKLIRQLSKHSRNLVELSSLCLGVECGHSDPTSGIVSNPLIGKITDRIVNAGGTVIMGETLEWLGVEDKLSARAVSKKIGQDIKNAVFRRENLAIKSGIDLLGKNPHRRNIEEGLTTIEEKASGSASKSGSVVISGVLEYGEAPKSPGLWLMDAASYTPESLTGFAASGAQMSILSTGSGNCYTSKLMPTFQLTANSETAKRLDCQIDFDCSSLMLGGDKIKVEEDLLKEILSIASGMFCYGEILGDGGETISRYGESL